MNYERIYSEFIADRRAKEADLIASGEYKERHHIVPRSMGGSDDAENLIALTAGDHYFAHLCLAKWHGGNQWAGVWAMSALKSRGREVKKYSRRKMVAVARKKSLGENNPSKMPHVKLLRKIQLTENNPMWGVDRSGENNPMFGVKLCGSKNGMFGKSMSDAEKAKRSKMYLGSNNPNYGRKLSAIAKQKISSATSVAVVNLDTGDRFDRVSDAALFVNRSVAAVSSCLVGKSKTCAGYRWAYAA